MVSDRENVAQMYDFHSIESNYRLMSAYLEGVWNTQTRQYETVYLDGSTEKLWQAMKQDFAEGTIGVRYLFDNSGERMENTCVTDLYFDYEVPPDPGEWNSTSYSSSFSITLSIPRGVHIHRRGGLGRSLFHHLHDCHDQVWIGVVLSRGEILLEQVFQCLGGELFQPGVLSQLVFGIVHSLEPPLFSLCCAVSLFLQGGSEKFSISRYVF